LIFNLEMKNIPLISAVLALMAVSCISPFTPEIETQTRYLTVNGLVTDANRRYEINLTLSRPLDETAAVAPARGAEVSVQDDQGHIWNFTEKGPGRYLSDSTLFRGVPGQIYTLRIEHEGKQYESAPCILRPASPIDTIVYEILDREINASGETEKVVRVALNTYDPAKDNHYFRWTFLETWEIHLPFNLLTYETAVCWTSEESHSILIANTEALSEDRITDFPLTVFNNSTDRGQYKYSMLAFQYSINYEEYEFWDNVKKVSENTGGLYDVIPAAVPGNVRCITDPEELVLGYFSVSGVSSKRVIIRSPLIVPDLYFDKCAYGDIAPRSPFPGLGINVWAVHEYGKPDGSVVWMITMNIACSDCSYFASNVKPDYWDEAFRQ
jgi:hypothetical protein